MRNVLSIPARYYIYLAEKISPRMVLNIFNYLKAIMRNLLEKYEFKLDKLIQKHLDLQTMQVSTRTIFFSIKFKICVFTINLIVFMIVFLDSCSK